MKKTLSILLLTALIFATVSAMSFGAFAAEATITPDTSWYTDEAYTANGNKYLLDDAADVLGFSNLLAGINVDAPQNFEGKTVELTANVNLDNNEWGLLVGALNDDATRPESRDPLEFAVLQNYGFWGTFDGNGYMISGIKFDGYVNDDTDAHDCTLFGIVPKGKTSTVKNLMIDSSKIEVSYFCGMIYSTIEGTATIDGLYIGKDAKINGCGQSIGTLAGRVMASGDLTIKNCVIEGTHVDDWQKNRFRGGIVSTSYGKLTIEDTAFYGEMTKYTGGIKDNSQHAGIIQVVGKDAKCTDASYAPSLTLKNVIICAKIANAYDEKGQNLKQVVYLMQEPGEGVTVNAENVFYVQSTAVIKGFAPEGSKVDRTAIMGSKAESFIAEKGLTTWYTTDKFMMPKGVIKMLYPEIVLPEDDEVVTTPAEVVTEPADDAQSETEAVAVEDTKGGCGSSVSFAGIALIASLGACAAISKKRR